jgi:hypothetical protein
MKGTESKLQPWDDPQWENVKEKVEKLLNGPNVDVTTAANDFRKICKDEDFIIISKKDLIEMKSEILLSHKIMSTKAEINHLQDMVVELKKLSDSI